MRLRFLGKATQGGGSPTLFATDRASYVVQGWKVTGASESVEIPHRLLSHLEPGTCLGVLLADTGKGSFTLSGRPVTDSEALSYMDIPGRQPGVAPAMARTRARCYDHRKGCGTHSNCLDSARRLYKMGIVDGASQHRSR